MFYQIDLPEPGNFPNIESIGVNDLLRQLSLAKSTDPAFSMLLQTRDLISGKIPTHNKLHFDFLIQETKLRFQSLYN